MGISTWLFHVTKVLVPGSIPLPWLNVLRLALAKCFVLPWLNVLCLALAKCVASCPGRNAMYHSAQLMPMVLVPGLPMVLVPGCFIFTMVLVPGFPMVLVPGCFILTTVLVPGSIFNFPG